MSTESIPLPQISLKNAILQLWNEARNIEYIACKLGLMDENGDPDTETVLDVVEDPSNYGDTI